MNMCCMCACICVKTCDYVCVCTSVSGCVHVYESMCAVYVCAHIYMNMCMCVHREVVSEWIQVPAAAAEVGRLQKAGGVSR